MGQLVSPRGLTPRILGLKVPQSTSGSSSEVIGDTIRCK